MKWIIQQMENRKKKNSRKLITLMKG